MTGEGTYNLTSTVQEVVDFWEWDALARERRWTDGLPVAPPTVERVTAILDHLGRDPDEALGSIPPAGGKLTVEQLAIQCAMAGCLPVHVPVVIAAVEAMLEPRFNLYGVQSTTNACSPLVMVFGPIVQEAGFNAKDGSFGGGSHANAAVGRAVRLILWNLGRAYPGDPDMAPMGQAAKYAFCTAENQGESPWPSIATDFGMDEDQSGVIVFGCQDPAPIAALGTPERILGVLATTLPGTGNSTIFWAAGEYLVTLNPRVAQTFADGGYSKEDVRTWLYEHARYRLGTLRESGVLVENQSGQYYWSEVHGAPDLRELPDDAWLPMVEDVNDIHLLVTGGWGQWWLGFAVGWGNSGGFAIAKPVTMPAGRSA